MPKRENAPATLLQRQGPAWCGLGCERRLRLVHCRRKSSVRRSVPWSSGGREGCRRLRKYGFPGWPLQNVMGWGEGGLVGGVCAWLQHLSLTMRKADWLTIGAWWLSFLHTCERRESETRYRGWAMSMVFRACVKVWERMVGSQRMKEAQARGRCSIVCGCIPPGWKDSFWKPG